MFNIADFVPTDEEPEQDKAPKDDSDKESGEEEMQEESQSDSQLNHDRIQNELEKIKPRLAVFKCVGIGLKNYSRELA